MKLNKSTTILLNIVLILFIALLVKFLIVVPKDVYAKANVEYKVVNWSGERTRKEQAQGHEAWLNSLAKEGWKFICFSSYKGMVFEREEKRAEKEEERAEREEKRARKEQPQMYAMKDITVIATSLADYVRDYGITPKQDGIYDEYSEFYLGLSPFYVKVLPITDSWGNKFRVYCGKACNGKYGITGCGSKDFIVVSFGRDGKEGDWKFNSSDPKAGLIMVKTENDLDIDLVMWNGTWIRCPKDKKD